MALQHRHCKAKGITDALRRSMQVASPVIMMTPVHRVPFEKATYLTVPAIVYLFQVAHVFLSFRFVIEMTLHA